MPALEILAATLLVFGSALVFRALIEADRLDEAIASVDVRETHIEEAPPLRQAA